MNNGPDRISCNDCNSACCRAGQGLELTPKELHRLEMAGTALRMVERSEYPQALKDLRFKPSRGREIYEMLTDCGNIVTNEQTGQTYCGDYDNRPKICREAKTGEVACKFARQQNYEPVMVTIGRRPE